MSATNGMENAVLLLYFNNTDHANIGDAAGLQNSAAAGNFYVSLHTGDPGEAGDQTTNEAAYTDYVRIAVARTAGGWTVASNAATNTAAIAFIVASGGSETETHFGIGTASSGAGTLLFKGTLSPNISVSSGVQPNIPIGDLSVTAD